MVNADDFGLSKGINRAVESAFHHGILRSASLMPNGSEFEDAVRLAFATPGLGVGIHLSLVGERCVSESPRIGRLADSDGMLPGSYGEFVKAYALRRFGAREIREEIQAQIRRVLDTGLRPTHLDSHQHLHLLPAIFRMVLDLARETGVPVIRVPFERGGPALGLSSGRGAQLRALILLSQLQRPRARQRGIRFADHFWGLGVSGSMNSATLRRILDGLGPGVNEVMCHPGFADSTTAARYPWNYHWDEEAAALQSAEVLSLVRERGIRLASFAEAF